MKITRKKTGTGKKKTDVIAILWNILYWKVLYTKLLSLMGMDQYVPFSMMSAFVIVLIVFLYSACKKKIAIYKDAAYFIPIIFSFLLLVYRIAMPNSFLIESSSYFFEYALLPAILILSLDCLEDFIKVYCEFSCITFIVLGFTPLFNASIFQSYMDYGYAVAVPCALGFYLIRAYFKRKIFIPLEIISYLFVLIYSNRGALLTILVFIVAYHIYVQKNSLKKSLQITGIATVGYLLYRNINKILIGLHDITKMLGYNSYAINKYMRMVSGDYTSLLSGRDDLLSASIRHIKDSAFGGSGIGYFESTTGLSSHNIFVDYVIYWGLIGALVFIITIIIIVRKMAIEKIISSKCFYLLVLCIWFPKLLLSGSFVFDIAYWSFLTMCFSKRNTKKYSTIRSFLYTLKSRG